MPTKDTVTIVQINGKSVPLFLYKGTPHLAVWRLGRALERKPGTGKYSPSRYIWETKSKYVSIPDAELYPICTSAVAGLGHKNTTVCVPVKHWGWMLDRLSRAYVVEPAKQALKRWLVPVNTSTDPLREYMVLQDSLGTLLEKRDALNGRIKQARVDIGRTRRQVIQQLQQEETAAV